MNKEEKIARARELAHNYKLQGYHCSESIIRAVPEAIGLKLSDDVVKAACGFFGGGGGTGGRCGVIESCLIIISMLYGRLDSETSDQDIRVLSLELMQRFTKHFGTKQCCEIKPKEIANFGEEYGCMRIYEEGAELVTKLLLEADEILAKSVD